MAKFKTFQAVWPETKKMLTEIGGQPKYHFEGERLVEIVH